MAIRFDASTDGTTVAATFATSGVYTLCGWLYMVVDQNAYSGVASIESATSPTCSLSTVADGTSLTAWDTAGTEPGNLAGANVAVETWYRWAITVAAGTTALYTGTATGALAKVSKAQTQNTAPTRVAFSKSVFGDWFNGRLAAVKAYNAQLSDAAVQLELGQNMPVQFASLKGWWPLVQDLNDYSGNGLHMVAGSTATTIEADPPIPWTVQPPPQPLVARRRAANW